MRPLLLLLGLIVLPIPNPTANEIFKALTGGNLKKKVKIALLCSVAHGNASTIELCGRYIAPTISPVESLCTPQPVLRKMHGNPNLF